MEEALLGAAESGAALPSFEEMEGTKEAEMTYLFKDKIDAFREEARAEGREEGIQVARREQRDLLVALAVHRFGTPAGRRLADALDGRARTCSPRRATSSSPARRQRSSSTGCPPDPHARREWAIAWPFPAVSSPTIARALLRAFFRTRRTAVTAPPPARRANV